MRCRVSGDRFTCRLTKSDARSSGSRGTRSARARASISGRAPVHGVVERRASRIPGRGGRLAADPSETDRFRGWPRGRRAEEEERVPGPPACRPGRSRSPRGAARRGEDKPKARSAVVRSGLRGCCRPGCPGGSAGEVDVVEADRELLTTRSRGPAASSSSSSMRSVRRVRMPSKPGHRRAGRRAGWRPASDQPVGVGVLGGSAARPASGMPPGRPRPGVVRSVTGRHGVAGEPGRGTRRNGSSASAMFALGVRVAHAQMVPADLPEGGPGEDAHARVLE